MKMFTLKEVAEILGVSDHTVRELINSNRLMCYRLNARTFRVAASAIETLLENSKSTQDNELAKLILAEASNAN